MVSKNEGKRIKSVVKEKIVARSGNPINLNIVSSQCVFDNKISYPYSFSLLVANTSHGPEGEGEFDITVYSTDQKMEVKPYPEA